jgi:PAS domain S-box-containing protein
MPGRTLPKKLVSQLIEAVKTGILLADNEGTIRFANEYLGTLLEYPKDSLIGKPLQHLFFHEDVPVFLANIMNLTLRDKGFEGEVLLRKGDGDSLFVKLSTARYREDSPERDILIITLQDISRFKQMEKNLFYSERFAGLGKMTDQIAHQIRNPVASIGGFALRLAKEKVPYELYARYTDIIYTEAIRLEQIINRLVEFAQVSSPHFRPINLAEIFQEVLKALALIQEANRSRIKIPSLEILPETTLYGDPGLLAQAVHYLLLNSLEASSDQDEIEVSGTVRDDQVIIEVKDRGEGVLPEHLPFVFDPFFSTKFNYLGLGLTTAKRIVTEHHGHVEILSIPKTGTEVSLVFPKDRRRPIRTRLI